MDDAISLKGNSKDSFVYPLIQFSPLDIYQAPFPKGASSESVWHLLVLT